MKLNKKHIIWIIIGIVLFILVVFQILRFSHNKKAVNYDKELLESCMNEDILPSMEFVVQALPDESILKKEELMSYEYTKELISENSKNILFLGEDKENSLYDTIGIISVEDKNKKVSIIMLPRDMYVDYSEYVRDALNQRGKSKTAGIYKLNAAHYIGAMIEYKGKFKANSISFLAEVIKEKFGITVDEYIKVNLSGFKQIVDLYGGVTITVPYDMNYDDPSQDLSIHLEKGKQHLNGIQAEGFVRFRQGIKEDGTRFDVDRKKNQLTFLNSFIKQHGTVNNINKIPDLIKSLKGNMMSSIDLGDVLITYLGIAKEIVNDQYEIDNKNINGEEKMIDGSSYIVIKE